MRKTQHTTRSATIAIAAMLALGTTPVLAQTAPETSSETAATPSEPIVILPEAMIQTEPAATTPTISPQLSSPVAPNSNNVSNPVVQAVPATPAQPVEEPAANDTSEEAASVSAASAPATAATTSTTRNTATQPRAAATTVAPVATAAATSIADTTGSDMTTGTEMIADPAAAPIDGEFATEAAAPVAATTAATPLAPTDAGTGFDWKTFTALALLGLIPIGMIALAMLWWRRRSRRAEIFVRDPDATRERYAKPAATTGTAPTTPKVAPLAAAAPVVDREPAIPVDTPLRSESVAPIKRATARPAASSGQVVLPSKMPDTYEERSALMHRMVAAKPDRANPFRSPKARAKRARLILQSLGRKFENSKPAFDLSQYAYIWPNLADTSDTRKVA